MYQLKELKTESLILRPLSLEYSEDYQKHFDDYRIIRYLSTDVPWPYPKNAAYEFIKNIILPDQGIGRFTYGIFLEEQSNELIGCIDLWRIPKPENRGFWLAHKHWSKGYMTQACGAINRLAFEELDFDCLYFSNAVGNKASSKIKQKTGAELLGLMDANFIDPTFGSAELWMLTKSQWQSFSNS